MHARRNVLLMVCTFEACLLVWAIGDLPAGPKGRELKLQEFCPVFTDRRTSLRSSRTVRYKGIKVRLSSREAFVKWLRDPSAYLDTKILPQFEDIKLPDRHIKQIYCPVYRNRKVSRVDPFVFYEGKRVYLFNAKAVRRWNLNPTKYFNLDRLPQFKTEKPAGEDSEELKDEPAQSE